MLDDYRLVTVTGPGGVGKTRLAGEVARRVADRFADGVWLVELAAVTDPARVPSAVAAALGIRERPGVPVADSLAGVLASWQVLLVLDNCEHVITAVAGLCGAVLLAADDVRILATSREPAGVAGEARYRLPPLGLPGPGQAEAGGSEAVALFADRARQADPHFTVSGEAGPLVARLVQRLDGMPLAIELAAARVEALGLAQLVDRLDDRFRLLVAGDRLAAARHRSLAATVDWSYQLLSGEEQRVFRWLSVFPAPFTLEGAEAVAGAVAGPVALRLVDCSLLAPPRTGPDSRARYLMMDTLRAYGAGLADAGEGAAADAALARYALQVAEQAAAGLQTGAGELAAAQWLDAEDATVHQVLAWALQHSPATALRLAIALAPWWQIRGRMVAGYPLLRAAAGHAAPGSDAWCAVHYWLGHAAESTGDFAGSVWYFTAVCDAVAGREPSPVLVDALAGRSLVLLAINRVAEGIEDARRAVALARKIGHPAGEALALSNLGTGQGRPAGVFSDRGVDDADRLGVDHGQVRIRCRCAVHLRRLPLQLVLAGLGRVRLGGQQAGQLGLPLGALLRRVLRQRPAQRSLAVTWIYLRKHHLVYGRVHLGALGQAQRARARPEPPARRLPGLGRVDVVAACGALALAARPGLRRQVEDVMPTR